MKNSPTAASGPRNVREHPRRPKGGRWLKHASSRPYPCLRLRDSHFRPLRTRTSCHRDRTPSGSSSLGLSACPHQLWREKVAAWKRIEYALPAKFRRPPPESSPLPAQEGFWNHRPAQDFPNYSVEGEVLREP